MPYSKQRLREIADLKRAAVDRIQSEIHELDVSPTRKYIEEFNSEFRTFEHVCEPEAIYADAAAADLIWVGDYHALTQSQLCAAEFIRNLGRRKSNLGVAVEPVFARSQKVLDRWLDGRITEAEFLDRIRYPEEWGCDWRGYRAIFNAAREFGIPVFGVDCHPRYDMRSIGRRDQGTARCIARLIERDPLRTLVVVFGESHLASNHLPRRVRAILARKGISVRELLVLQNVDQIYWQLQEQGLQDVRAVRLAENRYSMFNATPIEKYESFRQYLHGLEDDGWLEWTRPAPTGIDVLLDFLNVKKRDAVINHMPVLTGDLPLASAAENFARFVHQACRGDLSRRSNRSPDDTFFVEVIESALGYFCSKLLDSSRDGIEPLTQRLFSRIHQDEQLVHTIAWLIDPSKTPATRHFAAIRDAVEAGFGAQRTQQMLCRVLGYALGRRVYQGFLESRISRREICALLHDPLNERRRPLQCYIQLNQRLA